MNIFKEYITLISAIFKNSPSSPLKHVEMKYVLFKNYDALCWAGLLITRPGYIVSSIVENHEDIHRQQALLLGSYWKFYLAYLWEYICGFFILWSFDAAYSTISFEIQAYGRQADLKYKVTQDNIKLYKIKNKRKAWKENKNSWRAYCRRIEG